MPLNKIPTAEIALWTMSIVIGAAVTDGPAPHACRGSGARLFATAGNSAAELAQAYRRSDVTIIESCPQLLAREDIDVSQEMRRILSSGGITNKLIRRYRKL